MGAWVCIGSGPSLTPEDCELVRQSGLPTIVVNTTYQACPWAHILYAMDSTWWKRYGDDVAKVFKGRKITPHKDIPGAERMHFQYGDNSGYGAIMLAKKLGAETVILLGYDCQHGYNGETHHHGDHPEGLNNAGRVNEWYRDFRGVLRHQINVVNCSRRTRLDFFKQMNLEDALCLT